MNTQTSYSTLLASAKYTLKDIVRFDRVSPLSDSDWCRHNRHKIGNIGSIVDIWANSEHLVVYELDIGLVLYEDEIELVFTT